MMTLPRRRALGFAIGGLLVPTIARAQDTSAATRPIQLLYNALEQLMKQGQSVSFPQRFDTLAPVVEQVYDLETVLRVSIGVRWATLDDAAKQALFRAFRSFTIATYVANFSSYNGQTFENHARSAGIGARCRC